MEIHTLWTTSSTEAQRTRIVSHLAPARRRRSRRRRRIAIVLATGIVLRTAVSTERRGAQRVTGRTDRSITTTTLHHARIIGPDTVHLLGNLHLEDLVDRVANPGPLEQRCGFPRHDGGQKQQCTGGACPDIVVAATSHGGLVARSHRSKSRVCCCAERIGPSWLAGWVALFNSPSRAVRAVAGLNCRVHRWATTSVSKISLHSRISESCRVRG